MAERGAPSPLIVKTTCPYCGTGCGVDATVSGGVVGIAGDAAHPTNFGKLCVKGAALGDTVVSNGRLLHPMLRPGEDRSAAPERVSWDQALDHVADRIRKIIGEHGRESVAWYVSGQLLTEDYYVANKLVKGYVGTANIDTNSRLCMSSAVAGHKRAFGEDIVPVSYEDLETADLLIMVGSNTAWCHPILFQRMTRAKERRPEMKIVVIDPRRTATTQMADLHLPVHPGTDVWLFNGLLSYLNRQDLVDEAFVESSTLGLRAALKIADESAGDLASVASRCKISPALLLEFYELFAATQKVVTCFSMGVNQSSSGTDKVNSIINCHLLTGRIGKPGMGPFSLTGQPNAMGGREVGGLSNMLAAHMDLDNAAHRDTVQSFWQSPLLADRPGLKAVDLFDAIDDGRVKAVWIIATNPVVSMPDADKIKRALRRCDLVIVSDVMANTDTTAFADVLLPAQGWGEKDGTVTNSERCISRQRAFVPALGEARADWWMLSEVARRWGYGEHFAYASARDIFDEHARLSAWRNDGERYFDIGGLTGMDQAAYDALEPVRWPVMPAGHERSLQVFADGRFYHDDHRARFVPTPPRAPMYEVDAEFPLTLNTGRVRDHWHTMTRTGLSATLASHIDEPYVDLHADDAAASGVQEGELARVRTHWGSLVARVQISGEMPPRNVFVPIHWSSQFSSDARVGALVNPVVDPVSGEPEFKHTPVRVEAFASSWRGFLLSRHEIAAPGVGGTSWWTRVTGTCFTRFELAGDDVDQPWPELARASLGASDLSEDWVEYEDRGTGTYRAAMLVDGRIQAAIYISRKADLPARAWLSGLFAKNELDETDRIGLLLGESAGPVVDDGPQICSCYAVGRNTIVAAIKAGVTTTQGLGERLRCGTNCGSCVPELRKLIRQNTNIPA